MSTPPLSAMTMCHYLTSCVTTLHVVHRTVGVDSFLPLKSVLEALQREYLSATPEVKTIQRYTRGFLCRLKLWKDAVRSEEELWAASEIQRCWRGYWGRVLYESAYEEQWRREMGAALIQRNVRGFLARQRVRRMRRKMARSIFELARSRFRAAQKIQALARGVSTRKVTNAQRRRGYVAASFVNVVSSRVFEVCCAPCDFLSPHPCLFFTGILCERCSVDCAHSACALLVWPERLLFLCMV